MAAQIYEVDGYYLDLDEILYITKNGHVAMSPGGHTVASIHADYTEKLVNAWAKWKEFKFKKKG